MKCKKCGFISFDHNRNCPKCKKSLREQAEKMNLPDFKPSPPFLLGSLLGEETKPRVCMDPAHPPGESAENNEIVTGHGDVNGVAASFDSDEDMEIHLDDVYSEQAPAARFNLPGLAEAVAEIDSESAETAGLSIDFEDVSRDESSEDQVPVKVERDTPSEAAAASSGHEEIPFDSDELGIELGGKHEDRPPESPMPGDLDYGGTIEMELEQSPDGRADSQVLEEQAEEDFTIELDDFDFEEVEGEARKEKV